ncbi:MAG: HipA domain-containing protein [Elusimicrobia bacterium]|nr:HipA domain-containing protein [Elusimicrobiota bacterium]
MTRCHCCQKNRSNFISYHTHCLKKLFGVSWTPKIPFGIQELPAQIIKLKGRMSISGVQMKVSIQLNLSRKEIEVIDKGGSYILKPEPPEFPELPQNENLCMNMAGEMGMDVPAHGLFNMADSKPCYIIKRFDRLNNDQKLHKETMFQILLAEDKYQGSLEKVGGAIQKHATNIGLDAINFFERVLFCFIIGNGDMHLKNWSLIIQETREVSLAPCYDLVCSKLYIPNEEESALTLNGKKSRLERKDFESLALGLKIEIKAIKNVLEKFRSAKEKILEMTASSELSDSKKQQLKDIILNRYQQLYQT